VEVEFILAVDQYVRYRVTLYGGTFLLQAHLGNSLIIHRLLENNYYYELNILGAQRYYIQHPHNRHPHT